MSSARPPRRAVAAAFVALALVPAGDARAVSTHSSAIDVTPDGTEIWVVNPDHGTVGVLSANGAASAFLTEVAVGAEPWTVDIHPSNGEVWVTSMAENRVYVIDGPSRSVITTIDNLGFETYGVAFNPAGTAALVTASGSDQLFEIDAATRSVTRTLSTYRRPRGIAWRNDGARAWITHLLMPEFFGRVTQYFVATGTKSEILVNQVFHPNNGGYPSTVQNITLAPAPGDTLLWIPNNMINTTAGQLSGTPLTPSNIFHAVVSVVNANTSSHNAAQTYYMSQAGTDVGGPIAVDFKNSRAFVANLHSDDVTVLTSNILAPSEVGMVAAGKAPIGIVTSPTVNQAYVANWLSRNVTVFATGTLGVLATVPSTAQPEPLTTSVLNGKRHFFSSAPPMAVNDVGACASCHVWGTMDARRWDLSQFGKHLRGTPDVRGIGLTGAHDWTGDKDEMQDHEFGILEFTGGAGLTGGAANPPLGAPNKGLSQDLDDIGQFMATLFPRTRTPFQNPDGSLTASADSGMAIFNDPIVGCADCHIPPLYTDSRLDLPFIKHDVGTADLSDLDGAAGYDTPTLCGIWDTGQYLHMNFDNLTLQSVFTVFNPANQHGTTSHLTAQQLNNLLDFLRQIAWPESTGTPVGAPETPLAVRTPGSLESVFPNPFDDATSFRFTLDAPARDLRIDVFDVSGRRVRQLFDRRLPRGTHIVGWDGRDDRSERVAAGTYFARLFVDGERRGEKKLTLLH